MAESWVRLWAGMTTDPKWQTVARKSGQPRALVIALFTHLMLEANEAEDRGSVVSVDIEDAASALDCDEEAVRAILEAMDGRVIEDGRLAGWERRQPQREDLGNPSTGAKSAAQRKREQRAREAAARGAQADDVTTGHDTSRNVTTGHAPEADSEAEKPVNPSRASTTCTGVVREAAEHTAVPQDTPDSKAEPVPHSLSTRRGLVCRLLRQAGISDAAPHLLPDETWEQILRKRTDEEIVEFARAKLAVRAGKRTGLKYLAPGLLEDPKPLATPIAGARASPGWRMTRDESRAIAASTRLSDFRAACAADQGQNDELTIEAPAAPRQLG